MDRSDDILSSNLEDSESLLEAFAMESLEGLEAIEAALNTLRTNPWQLALLPDMLRRIHTLKSNAATLALDTLHHLGHWTEALVDWIFHARVPPAQELIELLADATDQLKTLCQQLSGPTRVSHDSSEARRTSDAVHLLLRRLERTWHSLQSGMEAPPTPIGELLVAQGLLSRRDLERVLELQQQPTGELLVALGLATRDQVAHALARQPGPSTSRTQLRVDARRLEHLQGLAETLLIEAARVDVSLGSWVPLQGLRELRSLARSLWTGLHGLRQTALGPLLERLKTNVLDMAARKHRTLEVHLEGGELELEAEYVTALASVLPHALRNFIEHGLEPEPERIAKNKPASGRVWMRASRVGQELHLMLVDDGRGVDLQALSAQARSRGLPDSTTGVGPGRYELLFLPGFSTRTTPDLHAGRGLGLSAIREAVSRLGGQVFLDEAVTGGIEMRVILPSKAGHLDGLVVMSNNQRYVLPAHAVVEFSRPTVQQCRSLTGVVPSLPLRGTSVPLVWLDARLGRCPTNRPLWECLVVLVNLGGATWGLVVEELVGPQLIPTPLTPATGIPGYLGRVVLEGGEVADVVDLPSLLVA